jgi:rhodanese-related sulfurtransferase
MKKKTTIFALVLSFVLVFGAFQSVFAAFPESGIETLLTTKNEVDVERVAMKLNSETAEGKYKLVDTDTLKTWVDNGNKMLIVDTMPAGWFAQRHIPGAVNAFAPLEGETYTKEDKANLLKQVKAFSGTKKVTKYYNKKTKKWQTKKIKGAKTKKVSVAVKNKKIVVYCGFVKCTRSHMAAKYLVEQGYTNVYRQPGGISAWVDAGYAVEGTDADKKDYVNMSAEEWATYGIDAGEITNSDYIIDVRPDVINGNGKSEKGYVPGAVEATVTNPYTPEQKDAIKAAADAQSGGGRIVIVCVSGNMFARNAMAALQEAGQDMSKVTYLKGGFNNAWSKYYPVISTDKKSVSVPAWVTEGEGEGGKLLMANGKDPEYADQTHHVLVNENGSNAKVALLNTKALPKQVYQALAAIGGTPCDKYNKADCFDADGKAVNSFLPADSQKINVKFEYGEGKTATMSDFFFHLTGKGKNADVKTEPYTADMRFGGCMENINNYFDSKSGNQTGCITCTFSCWIGTVSNGAYAYSSEESLVNRANVPAVGTPVTVVYTLG